MEKGVWGYGGIGEEDMRCREWVVWCEWDLRYAD